MKNYNSTYKLGRLDNMLKFMHDCNPTLPINDYTIGLARQEMRKHVGIQSCIARSKKHPHDYQTKIVANGFGNYIQLHETVIEEYLFRTISTIISNKNSFNFKIIPFIKNGGTIHFTYSAIIHSCFSCLVYERFTTRKFTWNISTAS
jgi:hypothetical protein